MTSSPTFPVESRPKRRESRKRRLQEGGSAQALRMRLGERAMRRGRVWVAAAAAATLAVAALEALACWLMKRRRPAAVREVLFFPSRLTCVEELLAEEGAPEPAGRLRPAPRCACPLPHHRESALARLLAHLLRARRSLELCLFAFSSPQLSRAVLLLHARGVRVRVVVDSDYMALNGSQIGRLRQAGIQVRHDQDSGYMHHKFAVIDKKMLITGSLNWTTQAIQNNKENVLIVEDTACVNIFLAEFEKIWEDYNPANYTFFPKEEKQVLKKTTCGTEKQLSK
ncbi:mitochondrial cardiolipin hydrolase [Hemicordylus capensis]|uniref:mitochondrial cardiolipin hydrolase n=1 Tax=Hemicordylus capensis TaxID=884348 RepID=UPI002302A25D|nr:mitochondrial cardiolipin hydrolase [Hemicordylus capensis]